MVRPLVLGNGSLHLGYGAASGACEKGMQWQMTLACLKDNELGSHLVSSKLGLLNQHFSGPLLG